MRKNLSSLNFSHCFCNKNIYFGQYETTYNSAYKDYYKEEKDSKTNNIHTNKKPINFKPCHLFLNQTKIDVPNSKLICPNCINKKIVQSKSRSRIRRSKNYGLGYFEDKMRTIYENKKKKDIKNREERAKKTYDSLINNRGRSDENYIKIDGTNNNTSRDGEYFGQDIEYGMLRCRNRELKNDKKIFGIDLKKRLKKSKSNIGYNYLLDKNEYSEIINKQIEKNNKKNENEKSYILKEEKELLSKRLQNEKDKINEEKENKNNIRNEMNRINSALLKEKKIRENNEKRRKKREKECISKICRQQIEEFVHNLKMKKLRNRNIDEENYQTAQNKSKNKNKKLNLIKNDKTVYGLPLKGIENKKCDKCLRNYPKNVLSQIYYSYNEQQKK